MSVVPVMLMDDRPIIVKLAVPVDVLDTKGVLNTSIDNAAYLRCDFGLTTPSSDDGLLYKPLQTAPMVPMDMDLDAFECPNALRQGLPSLEKDHGPPYPSLVLVHVCHRLGEGVM